MIRVLKKPGKSGNIIATIAISKKYYDFWKKYVYSNWKIYCDKFNLGLIVIDDFLDKSKSKKKATWHKLLIGKALLNSNISKKISNICYLDSDILSKYGSDCYLCGLAIDLLAPRSIGSDGWQNSLHLEHVIPLSKGGNDTIENIRPSHGLCNLRKGSSL